MMGLVRWASNIIHFIVTTKIEERKELDNIDPDFPEVIKLSHPKIIRASGSKSLNINKERVRQ